LRISDCLEWATERFVEYCQTMHCIKLELFCED